MKMGTAEQSWNLQGWLSVGSHKLVQQTLRALVRQCNHPYAVREMTMMPWVNCFWLVPWMAAAGSQKIVSCNWSAVAGSVGCCRASVGVSSEIRSIRLALNISSHKRQETSSEEFLFGIRNIDVVTTGESFD